MNVKQILLIGLVLVLMTGTFLLGKYIYEPNPEPIAVKTPVELTNTDSIVEAIEELKIKTDTIKKYYEKKVFNYRTAPTNKRIQLFSDRINR